MLMRYLNVCIDSINPQAQKAVILSHGGYTPKRNNIQKGSGKILVPAGLTLLFNSLEDSPSIGTKALHLLQGFNVSPVDKALSGVLINNYSLTYNNIFNPVKPNEEYDLITISPAGKAHMSDVFDAIRIHNKRYINIHSFACRINKLTFSF